MINPHNQEDNNYSIVFFNGEFNENLLDNCYVSEIKGDDSLLFVSAFKKFEDIQVFYKIKHIEGKVVYTISAINSDLFSKAYHIKSYKYIFHAH